jgi:hypothetical protein
MLKAYAFLSLDVQFLHSILGSGSEMKRPLDLGKIAKQVDWC